MVRMGQNINHYQNYSILEMDIHHSIKNGEIKTSGTDIDKLMSPFARFGSGKRAEKKQTIIDKLNQMANKEKWVTGNHPLVPDDPDLPL